MSTKSVNSAESVQIMALTDSINHWWDNLLTLIGNREVGDWLWDNIDVGCSSCPLCNEYRADNCISCPIQIKTGQHSCHGTPYDDVYASYHWKVTWNFWDFARSYQGIYDAISNELEFLIQLRIELCRQMGMSHPQDVGKI